MLTVILVALLVAALAQAIPSHILGRRARRRVAELEAENGKLAELVLAGHEERLLLPEDATAAMDLMATIAKAAEANDDKGLDRLLDLISTRSLTGVDKGMAERRRIAVFRFGDLAVRDTPTRERWNPDILYKGVWVGVLKGERRDRFRAIVDRKLLEAAGQETERP